MSFTISVDHTIVVIPLACHSTNCMFYITAYRSEFYDLCRSYHWHIIQPTVCSTSQPTDLSFTISVDHTIVVIPLACHSTNCMFYITAYRSEFYDLCRSYHWHIIQPTVCSTSQLTDLSFTISVDHAIGISFNQLYVLHHSLQI